MVLEVLVKFCKGDSLLLWPGWRGLPVWEGWSEPLGWSTAVGETAPPTPQPPEDRPKSGNRKHGAWPSPPDSDQGPDQGPQVPAGLGQPPSPTPVLLHHGACPADAAEPQSPVGSGRAAETELRVEVKFIWVESEPETMELSARRSATTMPQSTSNRVSPSHGGHFESSWLQVYQFWLLSESFFKMCLLGHEILC